MLLETLLAASLAGGVACARSLVFTQASSNDAPTCATYHGTYEGTAVYAYDDDSCADTMNQEWFPTLSSARIIPASEDGSSSVLLHVQRARTIDNDKSDDASTWLASVNAHIREVQAQLQVRETAEQQHLFKILNRPDLVPMDPHPRLRCQLVHQDEHSSGLSAFYMLARDSLPMADRFFPPSAVLVSVPEEPLPRPSYSVNGTKNNVPQWLLDSLKDVHYSPLVDAILQDVNPEVIEKDVRHLTGEDGQATWRTRHSFTDGGLEAGHWIKDTVERESGAKCHLHDHNYGFNPNVICEFKGTEHPEELVILGAHYDSRGTFGCVRAPGGDDDASGVSALMSLARIFKAYNIQFKRTVVLAFFSGEEQGLWGSRGYAKQLKDLQEEQKEKEDGLKIRFMLQADMLGYHAPGEPMQLALPDKYDTIEARWLVGNLSMTYVPDLQVGTTPACCSDHQSFDQQGFVSTWVFERNGPIADPDYHNSLDLSDREGYDFNQIAAIARVMLATVLEVAGFRL